MATGYGDVPVDPAATVMASPTPGATCRTLAFDY